MKNYLLMSPAAVVIGALRVNVMHKKWFLLSNQLDGFNLRGSNSAISFSSLLNVGQLLRKNLLL